MANGKNPISYSDIFDLSDDKVIVNFIKSIQKVNSEVEKLITAFDGLAKAQRDSLQRATKDIIDYTKSLSTASIEGKKALIGISSAVDDLKKRQASQIDTEKSLDKVRKDANKSIDNLANAIKALTENIKTMSKANGNSVSVEKQLVRIREEQQKQTDKLLKQISDLKDRQKQLSDSQKQQIQSGKESSKQLKDSQKEIESLQKKLESLSKSYDKLKTSQDITNPKGNNNAPIASMKGLEQAIAGLTLQYKLLDSASEKDAEAMKVVSKQIRELKTQYNALAKDTKVASNTISTATNYYKEMEDRVRALTLRLKQMPDAFNPITIETKQLIADIKAGNQQLKDFDKQIGVYNRNVGNYADGFKNISNAVLGFSSPMGGAILAITALTEIANKAIKSNLEFEDSLSDVQRTAGLTAEEVDNLAEQLKKIDTRTSLKGLIDIAVIGGQLGIAKEELAGFTEAIDQLAVVLDKEISGGAEKIASSLGKVNTQFKVAQKEGISTQEAMLKTGSAILKLGQSGIATGDFLVEFSQRVGDVANRSGISIPVMLSFGATLEESGISAETASAAFNNLIKMISRQPKEFFKIASLADTNMNLKQFTELINTDTSKALTLFAKGLSLGGGKMTEFQRITEFLGINSDELNRVVASLTGSIGDSKTGLISKINDAQQAYSDGSLATEQFKIKNENLTGALNRLGNAFSEAFASSSLSKGLASLLNSMIVTKTKGEDLAETYKDLGKTFTSLTEELPQLLSKYDELQAKSLRLGGINKLTAKEQEDLNKTIVEIGKIMPDAITKVDMYGNTVEIARGSIEGMTKAMLKNIQLINREAVEALRNENRVRQENIKTLEKEIELGTKRVKAFVSGPQAVEQVLPVDKLKNATQVAQNNQKILESIKKIRDVLGTPLTKEEQEFYDKFYSGKTNPATVSEEDPLSKTLEDRLAKLQKELDASKKGTKATKEAKTAIELLREQVNKYSLAIENQALKGNISIETLRKYKDATNKLQKAQEEASLVMLQAIDPMKALQEQSTTLQEKLSKEIQFGQNTEKTANSLKVVNEAIVEGQNALKLAIAETVGGIELLNTKLELSRQQFEKEAIQGDISNKTLSELQKTTNDVSEAQVNLQRAVLQATDPMGLLNFEIEQLALSMQKQVLQGGLSIETINKYTDSLIKLNKTQESLKDAQNPFFAQDIGVIQAETALAKVTPSARKQFDATGGGKQVEEARKIEEQVLQARIDRINAEQSAYDTSYKRWYELELEKTNVIAQQEENRTRITKEKQDKRNKIIEESSQLVIGLLSGLTEISRINSDNELAYLEQKKNKELEIVGNNNDAKTAIDKKYAKQQAEIRRRQAENEKKMALFDIAIQTGIAVSKAIASSPLTFGLPWSAFALAQGALQAGLVLAKPIPAYAKGTKNATEGLAIVGERGTEAIESKDGSIRLTQNKAHLAYLQQGDTVHTADSKETRMYRDALLGISGGSKSSNAYSDAYQSINSNKRKFEDNRVVQMARQMQLSPEAIATAMQKAIRNELVVEQHTFDENGYSSYRNKKGLSIKKLNSRNTFGSQG